MPQRILILNWRDIKNPNSGGAEVLTHEIIKRWVSWGNEVTQFSSYFKGAKGEEIVDGVKIIRKGNPDARHLFSSVHFIAFLEYRKNFKGNFDVVIDEVHGLPFFTPLYVKERKVVLICEIAGKIWDANFPFPFNKIGKAVENNYFRLYKNIPFLTISPSTKEDLIQVGLKPDVVTVLPMGISVPKNIPNLKKEKTPTIIFVGRLLKAKGIEDAIEVCKQLKSSFPQIKLWVVGRGEDAYEKEIKNKVKKLDLLENVKFYGFLSQSDKFKMMQRAQVLITPSVKEGFGLTVPEAGIVGTPAVAYNVEGLRDIIQDGRTGILTNPNPVDMAEQVENMLRDSILYSKIQKGAFSFAKSLNWDNTAKKALGIIQK